MRVLRTNWKFAAFSQFLSTFSPLLDMSDVTVSMVEADLLHSTSVVLPRIMLRLLQTVTQDRKITAENWQAALRRQYLKRDPNNPSLVRDTNTSTAPSQSITPQPELDGSHEEDEAGAGTLSNDSGPPQSIEEFVASSKDWLLLPTLQKLDSLHTVSEWHFHNPMRLRTLMKSNDDNADWRTEPIGYDAKLNAYWLIGQDRLWIQRSRPKPPRTASLKRKRSQAAPPKAQPTPKLSASKRAAPKHRDPPAHTSTRPGRSAKDTANRKLGDQARELAQLNRQAAQSVSARATTTSAPAPRGTRTSSRLRGANDEWQQVPDEWLEKPDDNDPPSDSDSALSELTELSEDDNVDVPVPAAAEEPVEETSFVREESKPPVPDDFIEWETVCVTASEWDTFPEQFRTATHYTEKALYKYLVNHLVPIVVAELKELERQKRIDEAVINRKRSARIAIRESEREEAVSAKKREAEEAIQMARSRRAELREEKGVEERLEREKAREQRRIERANREARRKEAAMEEAQDESGDVDVEDQDSAPVAPVGQDVAMGNHASVPPPSEPIALSCDVCGRQGHNIDMGIPTIHCARCHVRQHRHCHDLMISRAGYPPADWAMTPLICRRCRSAPTPGSVLNGAGPSRSTSQWPVPPQHEYRAPPVPVHGWQAHSPPPLVGASEYKPPPAGVHDYRAPPQAGAHEYRMAPAPMVPQHPLAAPMAPHHPPHASYSAQVPAGAKPWQNGRDETAPPRTSPFCERSTADMAVRPTFPQQPPPVVNHHIPGTSHPPAAPYGLSSSNTGREYRHMNGNGAYPHPHAEPPSTMWPRP